MSVLLQTPLPNAIHQGKVRDLYEFGDRLLIVATDRISAFDVVLPNGVPGKGAVLTQIAAFWFTRTSAVLRNPYLRLAAGPADHHPHRRHPAPAGFVRIPLPGHRRETLLASQIPTQTSRARTHHRQTVGRCNIDRHVSGRPLANLGLRSGLW